MSNYKKNTRADHNGNQQGIFKHNKAILRKTATCCAICGLPFDKSLKYPNPMSISIDHIIPMKHNGNSNMDNLQAVHLICNKQKGTKILAKPGERAEPKPRKYELNGLPQYIDWANYEG